MPRRLALLLLSCLLIACSGEPPAPASSPSLTVSVAPVQQQVLPLTLSAAGSVAAWQHMPIGSELGGLRVSEVLVDVGAPVRAGQVLLRLDARQLRMQLRQAEAALNQAEAQLTLANSNAARAQALIERKLIAQRDADETLANRQLALAQALSARAQRDQAQLQVEFATLKAPHAGVIAQRQVEPGQVVAAGSMLFSLIRDGRLEWRAELPEMDLLRVSVGMPVQLRDGNGGTVTGKVRAVSPALDPQSRTGSIYADLPTPGALRAGMYASGELQLGERAMRSLPDSAIVERDGHRYVFVLGADDKVAQRRVATGSRQGDRVEVRDGVADGEQVVVQGAGFLADGDRVRVVTADAEAVIATPADVTP